MEVLDWATAPDWASHVIKSESGTLVLVPQYGGICIGETLATSMQHMVNMNEGHSWILVESRNPEPIK